MLQVDHCRVSVAIVVSNHIQCPNQTLFARREAVFTKDKSIVPQSHMEIGLVNLAQGNKEEAKKILEDTIKNFSKYLSENIVHIKSYAALRALGVSTDKTVEDAGDEVNLDEELEVESSESEDEEDK